MCIRQLSYNFDFGEMYGQYSPLEYTYTSMILPQLFLGAVVVDAFVAVVGSCGSCTVLLVSSVSIDYMFRKRLAIQSRRISVSYTHLRAHETPEHLVCR